MAALVLGECKLFVQISMNVIMINLRCKLLLAHAHNVTCSGYQAVFFSPSVAKEKNRRGDEARRAYTLDASTVLGKSCFTLPCMS